YVMYVYLFFFFFSSRRRHTRSKRDWSSDVCSSDLCRQFGHGYDLPERLLLRVVVRNELVAVGKVAGHEQIVAARELWLHFLRDRPLVLGEHDRREERSKRRAFADEPSDFLLVHRDSCRPVV